MTSNEKAGSKDPAFFIDPQQPPALPKGPTAHGKQGRWQTKRPGKNPAF